METVAFPSEALRMRAGAWSGLLMDTEGRSSEAFFLLPFSLRRPSLFPPGSVNDRESQFNLREIEQICRNLKEMAPAQQSSLGCALGVQNHRAVKISRTTCTRGSLPVRV